MDDANALSDCHSCPGLWCVCALAPVLRSLCRLLPVTLGGLPFSVSDGAKIALPLALCLLSRRKRSVCASQKSLRETDKEEVKQTKILKAIKLGGGWIFLFPVHVLWKIW